LGQRRLANGQACHALRAMDAAPAPTAPAASQASPAVPAPAQAPAGQAPAALAPAIAPPATFGAVDAYGARRSPDEVRIIREMLEEDVALFTRESGVDGPASRELLAEPPEIQWAVMQRGPVRSAANPSAALIGRIRDAKNGLSRGAGVTPSGLPPAIVSVDPGKPLNEVDKFVMENRLDTSAATALRSEPADVQRTVLQQGPLVNCRNPAGALMSRIRAARTGQTVYRPALPVTPGAQRPAVLQPVIPGTQAQSQGSHGVLPPPLLPVLQPGLQPQTQPQTMLALPAAPGDAAAPGASPGTVLVGTAPAGAAPPDDAALAGTGPASMATVEDARLNEEALKAIQKLNAAA